MQTESNHLYEKKIEELEKAIGYSFRNKDYLVNALTHSSYVNESKETDCRSNERLEFLGDSILGYVCSLTIFDQYHRFNEGDLSKIRAALVCEKSLAKYAQQINLGDYMRFSKSEILSGAKNRVSAIGDAFEALIAAIYLDGGFKEVQKFVVPFLEDNMDDAISGNLFKDSKTILQELVQQNKGEKLEYKVLKVSGPDHRRVFTIAVMLNSNQIGVGSGFSKKEAEHNAADEALKLMGL